MTRGEAPNANPWRRRWQLARLPLALTIGLAAAAADVYRSDVCPRREQPCPALTVPHKGIGDCHEEALGPVRNSLGRITGLCAANLGCAPRFCKARCVCGLDESSAGDWRCLPPEACGQESCEPGETRCLGSRRMERCNKLGEWARSSCERCVEKERPDGSVRAVCRTRKRT